MDWWRSQKYGYVPGSLKVTPNVAPLPASVELNRPSRLSGVP
jgi:hypothetical protein